VLIIGAKLPKHSKGKVIALSDGSPYKSKVLTKAAIDKSHLPEPELEKYLKTILEERFLSLSNDSRFTIVDDDIFLENKQLNSFSPKEKLLLKNFILSNRKIVTREDLADMLWGKGKFDKYSDWAIDKFISTMRKKIARTNTLAKIETIKGEGYKFSQ
jgi:DNA-binding response OmpR family regulator